MSVGTFKPEKLTKTFKARRDRGDYASQEGLDMMKSARAGTLAKKDIGSQVASSYTDPRTIDLEDLTVEVAGGVQTLSSAMVERIMRQSVAAMGIDVKTLSEAERQVLADKLEVTMLGDGGALRNPAETAASRQQVRGLIESIFLLRPGPNAPMPLRSKGFEPTKAAGGDLRKANETYGAAADISTNKLRRFAEADPATFGHKDVADLKRMARGILKRRGESEDYDLRKSNSSDTCASDLLQQVNALTEQVTAILKAKAGASSRFIPLRQNER